MGSLVAYFNGDDDNIPDLPNVIKENDLMNNKEDAINQFRDNYRSLGVVVIEMENDFNNDTKLYRSLCSDWFNNNTFKTKQNYSTKFSNELCKELGTKPNIGYILTSNIKEYIRLKKNSDSALFPNQNIYNQYHKLFDRWNIFTNKCVDIVFDEMVNVFDNKSQKYNIETLLNKQEKQELIERNLNYSSMSIIHYFGNGQQNENIDKRFKNIALDKHQDTGVMTFILCSDVIGLQVLDRKTDQYIPIEKYYNSNKCMFIISGRKMEHIFSWKKVIPATWHYVKIPVDQQRLSLLYFLEIQKDW